MNSDTNASAERPPQRLSNNPRHPDFDGEALQRGVRVRFKGRERTDVEAYDVAEGWIRVQAGKTMNRQGEPLTLKLNGPVEVWYAGTDTPENEAGSSPES